MHPVRADCPPNRTAEANSPWGRNTTGLFKWFDSNTPFLKFENHVAACSLLEKGHNNAFEMQMPFVHCFHPYSCTSVLTRRFVCGKVKVFMSCSTAPWQGKDNKVWIFTRSMAALTWHGWECSWMQVALALQLNGSKMSRKAGRHQCR